MWMYQPAADEEKRVVRSGYARKEPQYMNVAGSHISFWMQTSTSFLYQPVTTIHTSWGDPASHHVGFSLRCLAIE